MRSRRYAIRTACFAGAFALAAFTVHSFGSPGFSPGGSSHHRIVLRQVHEPDRTISMITVDYATGTASRIVVDESTGKVLRDQELPGRPQSSREEFQEAVRIIARDRKLGRFTVNGAIAEGGFIVDGPPGYPNHDRYIQIRLLSPDRQNLLRLVVVDLTRGAAASDSAWFD